MARLSPIRQTDRLVVRRTATRRSHCGGVSAHRRRQRSPAVGPGFSPARRGWSSRRPSTTPEHARRDVWVRWLRTHLGRLGSNVADAPSASHWSLPGWAVQPRVESSTTRCSRSAEGAVRRSLASHGDRATLSTTVLRLCRARLHVAASRDLHSARPRRSLLAVKHADRPGPLGRSSIRATHDSRLDGRLRCRAAMACRSLRTGCGSQSRWGRQALPSSTGRRALRSGRCSYLRTHDVGDVQHRWKPTRHAGNVAATSSSGRRQSWQQDPSLRSDDGMLPGPLRSVDGQLWVFGSRLLQSTIERSPLARALSSGASQG